MKLGSITTTTVYAVVAAPTPAADIRQLESLDLKPLLEGDPKLHKGYRLIGDTLFNLITDPSESSNVLSDNLEIAERRQRKLDQYLDKISAKMPVHATTPAE